MKTLNGRVGVTVLTTVRLSVRSRSKVTHSARFQFIRIAGGQRKRFVDPDRFMALEQLTYNVQRNDHPNTKS